jgi:hypothetical protein
MTMSELHALASGDDYTESFLKDQPGHVYVLE